MMKSLRFCKNERSKRSKNNEKGVNKIENQGENSYKMLQNGQMTDLGETLYVLTLGQNISVTKYDRDKSFFSAERRVNKI